MLLSKRFLITLLAVVVSVIFFSNLPTYGYNVGGGVAPLYFYFLAIGFAFGVIFLSPKTLSPLSREIVFWWFLFYAVAGMLWVVFLQDYYAIDIRSWRLRLLLLFLFSSGYVLYFGSKKEHVSLALFSCAVLAALTYWHDFLVPFFYVPNGFEGSNPGRGAGFFVNANQAGNAIVLMSILAMPFIDRKFRPALAVVMLVGVFPTFSRSSILLATLVFITWFFAKQFRSRSLVILIILLPSGLYLGQYLLSLGLSSSLINYENVIGRLAFFLNFGESLDYSAAERKYLVSLAIERFSANPVLGIGVGETHVGTIGPWGYPVSTHNMYLLLAVEQGVFGLLIYLSLVLAVFMRGWRLFVGAVDLFDRDLGCAILLLAFYFFFIGFFSHTLLEEPYSVLGLSFLLAASAGHQVKENRTLIS